MKNAPVMTSVIVSMSSMRPQFDAIGVIHHGLAK